MTKKELIKAFAHVKSISLYSDSLKWKIYEEVLEDRAKVIKKEWGNRYKNENPKYYQLNLKIKEHWITFADHSYLEFTFDGKLIKVTVTIYNQSDFSGWWDDKFIFKADLHLSIDFILNLKDIIDEALEDKLRKEYLAFLQAQAQLWVKTKRKLLLNS